MPNLFTDSSSNPKWNAQRNLEGRTHYVDDNTLKGFRSRIISARAVHEGLLFAIVTSDSLDYQHSKRGFRYVIFDLFGTVVARTEIEGAYRTSQQATKAMWSVVNGLAPNLLTLDAIAHQERLHAQEMAELRASINKRMSPWTGTEAA